MNKKVIACFMSIVVMIFYIGFGNMNVIAEEVSSCGSGYQEILNYAKEYAQEYYMEMVNIIAEGMQEEMGISISDMSNISMGEPYYIYDVRKELQSARFYFPIYDENQIILMLHINYTSEGWKVTMDTEYTDVLNELDYKNTDCIFYYIGSDIYAENETQVRLIQGNGKKTDEFINKSFEEKKSAVEAGLKQMSYITEESDSGSEYCETMDIADAELFANDNFRDYLLEYYPYTKSEVQNLHLGKPFVEYNVDGTCFALVYFPVYDDDKVKTVISANYQQHHWYLDFKLKADVSLLGIIDSSRMTNLLNTAFKDENKYENADVIVYTINNMCYVETPYQCYRCVTNAMIKKYQNVFSEEEEEFLKMSWKDKKQLAEDGIKNWKEFDVLEWMRDEDHSRMESTVGGNDGIEKVRGSGLDPSIAGCIVLAGGAAAMLIIKKKTEK